MSQSLENPRKKYTGSLLGAAAKNTRDIIDKTLDRAGSMAGLASLRPNSSREIPPQISPQEAVDEIYRLRELFYEQSEAYFRALLIGAEKPYDPPMTTNNNQPVFDLTQEHTELS